MVLEVIHVVRVGLELFVQEVWCTVDHNAATPAHTPSPTPDIGMPLRMKSIRGGKKRLGTY